MLTSISIADNGIIENYIPNKEFRLPIHLTNSTGDVKGANCTIEIRNSTLDSIDFIQMNEINGGWYNATYNKSSSGYFPCRYNCTLGASYASDTCDFVIKGDNIMPVAIILTMAIAIAFMFVLSRYIVIEAFRYLLMSVSAILTILTVAIGLFLAKDSLPASVQNLMSTAYVITLYTFDFIIAIGFLFIVLYYTVKWLPERFRVKKQ